jgi:hypothetical protein
MSLLLCNADEYHDWLIDWLMVVHTLELMVFLSSFVGYGPAPPYLRHWIKEAAGSHW